MLYVDGNGNSITANSKFAAGDYVLFYGQGVTGWTYDPVAKQFSHYINHYTNNNEYFLQFAPGTGNGKQMPVVPGPGSGIQVTTTVGKVFFEEEKTNFVESGLQWYSAPINPNDSRVIVNSAEWLCFGFSDYVQLRIVVPFQRPGDIYYSGVWQSDRGVSDWGDR